MRIVAVPAGAGVLSVAVWVAALSGLSLFDADFAPGNMIAFGQYFRDQIQPDLPLLSLYYAKSILTNQLVNSVVSLQPDPTVPQDTLMLTLRYSWLGAAGVLAYVGVVAAAGVGAVRVWRPRFRGGVKDVAAAAAGDPMTAIAGYMVVLLAINLYVCAYAGFVYSGVMVPLIVLVLYRYLETLPRKVCWVAYGVVGLVVLVNSLQIRLFRDALG
jgi:hypothetical protein